MVGIVDVNDILSRMRSRVQEQGDVVRALKNKKASDTEINLALAELKARKRLLEEKELELMPPTASFDRGKLEDLLKQKFFYDQSFSIYGGIQGLYDYGPMGCAMKANLLAAWRQHFILEDQLLEVDCSMLTPAPVLQASGHVERFTDLMVKDVKTGECFRADHLVKANLEAKMKHKKTSEQEKGELERLLMQLDNFGAAELDSLIRKYDMRSPSTNNELSEPQQFNLMFETTIGPTGHCKGYLRPETAQGIFVNFQRLLQFNQGRIPFGAAQIGSAFRNEISPRSGLIRVREFAMAEIEYFVDPANKQHPKFERVKDLVMTLYSACSQMDGLPPTKMTIGEAVNKGIVANQTLGYFMARIHQFLILVGVDINRLRFRQHLSNEMAHYACDCWDAECQTSYGWIECVGCADRSCYDLTQHTKATGTRLVAEKRLPEPRLVKVCECVPNKQAIGKAFRADAKSITNHLASLSLDDALRMKDDLICKGSADLTINGKEYTIDPGMVHMKEYENNVHVEEVVPNVIEPSFGIGRVLYAIFEHSFRIREGDEQRTYLSVRPILAPYKCSVLPLSSHPDFVPFIQELSSSLTRHGVTHRVDDSSGSIGRRYARTDQIAIPYGITIDFDTVNKSPASATLRERDSMKQIRVPLSDLPLLVSNLSNGLIEWSEAQMQYPAFEQQETVSRDAEPQLQSVVVAAPSHLDALISKKKTSKKHKLHDLDVFNTKQIHQNETEPLGPMAESTAEDWQSVSEDIEEFENKPDRELDRDVDAWSSATETGEADAELTSTATTSCLGQGKLKEPVINKKVKGGPNKLGSSRMYSTAAKTAIKDADEISKNVPAKKPLSWTDWGKAVRRHYEMEEQREKLMEPKVVCSAPSLVADEPHSPFSGYEADQEDNAASKSVNPSHFSPQEKEHDTLYELSPAVQSLNEESFKDKNHSFHGAQDSLNLDTEFPPLASPSQPYHGLFVGKGWPGEKKADVGTKQEPINVSISKKEPKKKSGNDSKLKVSHENPTLKVSTDGTEWPSVMAQVFEDNCEPERWVQCLEHPFSPPGHSSSTDLQKTGVQMKTQNKSKLITVSKKVFHEVNKEVEHEADKFHGLFSGPGWPSTKSEAKNLQSSKKAKSAGKKQGIRSEPATSEHSAIISAPDLVTRTDNHSMEIQHTQHAELTPEAAQKAPFCDWKSVVSHIYDSTVASMVENNPFDLSGLLNVITPQDQPLTSEVKEETNPNVGLALDPSSTQLMNDFPSTLVTDVWKPTDNELSYSDHDLQREGTNYTTTSEGPMLEGDWNQEESCQFVDVPFVGSENVVPHQDSSPHPAVDVSSLPKAEPVDVNPVHADQLVNLPASVTMLGDSAEVSGVSGTSTLNKSKRNKNKRHKKKK